MGQGKVPVLTLLDLSAAFNTIDHTILLDRLQDWLCIEGIALKWIVSYLTGRCQTINIQGNLSVPMSLIYGVPQGSVLGPLLFILYTTPPSKIITNHKALQHHLYADDTQVYTSFKTTSNFSTSINNLHQCLLLVHD